MGYCFLVTSRQREAVLLDYFAVSAAMRGQGYGSKCFAMLREKVREQKYGTLILEVENPRFGENPAEVELRRRRIAFYIRNGMTLTHLRIFLYDVEYLVMTSDSAQMLRAAEQIYHVYEVLLKPDKIHSKLKISTNIRCVASDLDRTLLGGDGKLSVQTRQMIREAKELGIEVIIASGRAYDTLPEEIQKLPELRYAITSNGAVVSEHGACIKRSVLPVSCVQRVLNEYDLAKQQTAVAMEVFVDGKAYCEKQYFEHPELFGSGAAKEYVQRTRNPVEDIKEFAKDHMEILDSVDLISANVNIRETLRQKMESMEELCVTSSMEHLIEIAAREASKGAALEWLMHRLGIEPEECMAFGDADNDISMLRYAGIGIAVENASYQVKQEANYITKSNEEDGVSLVGEEIVKALGKDAGQ